MTTTEMGPSTRVPGPRERAYDAYVKPLVDRLIEVSNEHEIPLIFACELDSVGTDIVTPVTINSDDAFPLRSTRLCRAFDAIEYGVDQTASRFTLLTEFYEAQTTLDAVLDKGVGGFGSLSKYETASLDARTRLEAAKVALAAQDGG